MLKVKFVVEIGYLVIFFRLIKMFLINLIYCDFFCLFLNEDVFLFKVFKKYFLLLIRFFVNNFFIFLYLKYFFIFCLFFI